MKKAVYCPGSVHEKRKILFLLDEENNIYVQCSDRSCKRSSEGRGWHKVEIGESGAAILTPVKDARHFDLTPMPAMVKEPE